MERTGTCVCGAEFPIPAKRGRPPVRCVDCREAYSNGTLPDRLAQMGIDPDVALRKRIVLPVGDDTSDPEILAQREAQIEKTGKIKRTEEQIDRLEYELKMRGIHISQHRDKWE